MKYIFSDTVSPDASLLHDRISIRYCGGPFSIGEDRTV